MVLQRVQTTHVRQRDIGLAMPGVRHERGLGVIDILQPVKKRLGQRFGGIEIHRRVDNLAANGARAAEIIVLGINGHTALPAHVGNRQGHGDGARTLGELTEGLALENVFRHRPDGHVTGRQRGRHPAIRKADRQHKGVCRAILNGLYGLAPVHLDAGIILLVLKAGHQPHKIARIGQRRTTWRAVIDARILDPVIAREIAAVIGIERLAGDPIGIEDPQIAGQLSALFLANLGIGADRARHQERQNKRCRRDIGLALGNVLHRVGQCLTGRNLDIGNIIFGGNLGKRDY